MSNFCCSMRAYFLVGVMGQRAEGSAPIDVVDFVDDPSAKPMLINIKFCPFCGERIKDDETRRSSAPFQGGSSDGDG